MRKVHTLGVSLFCAAVAIACGGTSSDNPPGSGGNDAGSDATSNNPPQNGTDGGDSSVPTGDDGGACIIDADITKLAPADAALDEAGASVGTCLACAQTTCGTQLEACNAECSCNQGFTCFASCIGGVGNTLLSCVGQCFPGGLAGLQSDPGELGVVTCAAQSCGTQCATAGLLGGGGGNKDGGGGGKKDGGGNTGDGGDDGGEALDGASD